jgi:hypothetical protein
MGRLAGRASAIEFAVYNASASCDGNDIAANAGAPLVSRRVDGNGGTTLQLPAGDYLIVVHAFDPSGALIGSACQADLFTPGQKACLDIALSQPLYDGDGGARGDDLGVLDGGGGSGGGGTGGGGGNSGVVDMATPPFVAQSSGVSTDLYQAWSPGGGVAFVVGAAGVILKTTDHGANWTKLSSGTSENVESVWGSSASDVYAVGVRGLILHSTNGGTSWTSAGTGMTSFWDVWGASAGDVYIVGDRGTVLHGSGSSFSSVTTPAGLTTIWCVWGASAGDVYLYGNGGLALHGSAANGFGKLTSPTSDAFYYGWGGSASGDVWAPSINASNTSSTLWHSTDHGVSWQPQLTVGTQLWAVWSWPDGHALLVGNDIQETIDHGAHWSSAGTPPALLYGVGGDPAGSDVWAVGAGGLILHRP